MAISNQPRRLVVADDDWRLVEMVMLLVREEAGIEVVGRASNGQELVDLVRQLSPDIVLTDHHMPVKDGLSAVREFLEMGFHPMIICMTADGRDTVKKGFETVGAAFVYKDELPTGLPELLKTVMNAGAV